jgi:hypothetical protein
MKKIPAIIAVITGPAGIIVVKAIVRPTEIIKDITPANTTDCGFANESSYSSAKNIVYNTATSTKPSKEGTVTNEVIKLEHITESAPDKRPIDISLYIISPYFNVKAISII